MPDGSNYELGCPHISWLIDSPSSHYDAIIKLPRNTILGVVDQGHLDLINWLGLPNQSLFIPHKPNFFTFTQKPTTKRSKKVTFAGNVKNMVPIEHFKKNNPPVLHPVIEATYTAAQKLASKPVEPYRLFDACCLQNGINPNEIMPHIRASFLVLLETMGQNLLRKRLIGLLSKTSEINVFGNIDFHDEFKDKNIILHGSRDYPDLINVFEDSDLVIN